MAEPVKEIVNTKELEEISEQQDEEMSEENQSVPESEQDEDEK